MPRPSRCRRVCCEPLVRLFAPQGTEGTEPVVLLVEEYEAIRIVALEKRTHDQCAQQMQISRTTATEIYEKARFKIADAIVNGKPLKIGDHFILPNGFGNVELLGSMQIIASTI